MKRSSKRLTLNATTIRALACDEMRAIAGAGDPGVSDRSCWEICITRIPAQCTGYSRNCPVPQGGA